MALQRPHQGIVRVLKRFCLCSFACQSLFASALVPLANIREADASLVQSTHQTAYSSRPSSRLQIEIAAGPVCEESLLRVSPCTCQLICKESSVIVRRETVRGN